MSEIARPSSFCSDLRKVIFKANVQTHCLRAVRHEHVQSQSSVLDSYRPSSTAGLVTAASALSDTRPHPFHVSCSFLNDATPAKHILQVTTYQAVDEYEHLPFSTLYRMEHLFIFWWTHRFTQTSIVATKPSMHERLPIAHNVLRVVVTAVTLLNESIIFTSPWIISPSPSPVPTQAIPFPHPAFTSVAYALVEPLYVKLFVYAGIAPWIFVLNAPLHLFVCELPVEYLSHLLVGTSRHAMSLQSPGPSEPDGKGHWPGNLASEILPNLRDRPLSWHIYMATLVPVHSAAASNAALLLFAMDLDASLEGDSADVLLIFSYLAISFYLGSRYADVRISRSTCKTPLYRRQQLTRWTLQLGCLALLLLLKIGVRKLIGLPAFPMLQVISSREVQRPMVQEMPPWLSALIVRIPAWLSLVLSLITVPLSLYAARLFRQGLEG